MDDEDEDVKPMGHARPPKYRKYAHADIVRERIRASQLINRLMKHVFGKIEMSATQIRAAEILLKKIVPDLKQVEHTGSIQHLHVTELTDEQLTAIAASGLTGTADEASSAPEPAAVH